MGLFTKKPEKSPAPAPSAAPAAPRPAPGQQASRASAPAKATPKSAPDTRNFMLMLGEILSLMMRANGFQSMPLSAARQLVLPPMQAGQFIIAHAASENGGRSPVGALLWARVSPEVDKRLSENLDKPIVLDAKEWNSGAIAWVVAAVGERDVINTMLGQLQSETLKGAPLKVRASTDKGVASVRTITGAAKSAPKAAERRPEQRN
jgi:hemolysin-activating ACP:hemolysin acyltransferase